MGRSKRDAEKQPSLTEERLKEYASFRRNLRLLRVTTELSAEGLGKFLGFPKHHRVFDLEYGKATVPRLEEVKAIADYFKVSIDELLYKTAKISFE